MKAYEVGGVGIEHLEAVERPEPIAGPGEVLLRMRAVSLNYRDLLVVRGGYGRVAPRVVPLSDGVGEIVAVGEGVTGAKIGDRAAAAFMPGWTSGRLTAARAKTALGAGVDGVAAEYVVVPEEGVVHVPAHLSDEEAACLPCAGVTAWNALFGEGSLQAGQTVLVQGTGGVSIFALQFARLAGARVVATSSSSDKLGRARELGASDGINYRETPAWDERAFELTGRVGVDHVVEVGGAGTLARSIRAAAPGGTISLIGVLAGGGAEASLAPALMKNLRLQGIFVGPRETFEAMNRAIELHRLRPVVDRVFAFAELPDALRHMESGAHFRKRLPPIPRKCEDRRLAVNGRRR